MTRIEQLLLIGSKYKITDIVQYYDTPYVKGSFVLCDYNDATIVFKLYTVIDTIETTETKLYCIYTIESNIITITMSSTYWNSEEKNVPNITMALSDVDSIETYKNFLTESLDILYHRHLRLLSSLAARQHYIEICGIPVDNLLSTSSLYPPKDDNIYFRICPTDIKGIKSYMYPDNIKEIDLHNIRTQQYNKSNDTFTALSGIPAQSLINSMSVNNFQLPAHMISISTFTYFLMHKNIE